jgi:hypothetical protein
MWGRMVSRYFAEMTPFLRHLGIFYMPQIYDMGPTASAGFEPANVGTGGQFMHTKIKDL